MINTIVFAQGAGFGCHVVGIGRCTEIKSEKLGLIKDTVTYRYSAVYRDSDGDDKEFEIENVILATDIKLS